MLMGVGQCKGLMSFMPTARVGGRCAWVCLLQGMREGSLGAWVQAPVFYFSMGHQPGETPWHLSFKMGLKMMALSLGVD